MIETGCRCIGGPLHGKTVKFSDLVITIAKQSPCNVYDPEKPPLLWAYKEYNYYLRKTLFRQYFYIYQYFYDNNLPDEPFLSVLSLPCGKDFWNKVNDENFECPKISHKGKWE